MFILWNNIEPIR